MNVSVLRGHSEKSKIKVANFKMLNSERNLSLPMVRYSETSNIVFDDVMLCFFLVSLVNSPKYFSIEMKMYL